MLEINPVAKVTMPCGVVIICIPGEIGANDRIDNNRSGLDNDRSGGRKNDRSRSYNGEAYARTAEADVSAYINLRIAFRANEACGYDCCDSKYLLHICNF